MRGSALSPEKSIRRQAARTQYILSTHVPVMIHPTPANQSLWCHVSYLFLSLPEKQTLCEVGSMLQTQLVKCFRYCNSAYFNLAVSTWYLLAYWLRLGQLNIRYLLPLWNDFRWCFCTLGSAALCATCYDDCQCYAVFLYFPVTPVYRFICLEIWAAWRDVLPRSAN